jgi:GNAT superfamily N-acetyltransferase
LSDSQPVITIRPATPADVPVIVEMIEELAEFERLRDQCHAEASALQEHLFGPTPRAEVLLADHGGRPAGFALFFHNFSTFECAPGLYLEDIYVRPAFRGLGIGGKMMARLAAEAVARGCQRFEWWVLDWNREAIDFYLRLGAKPMSDWTVYRLEGDALHALAKSP